MTNISGQKLKNIISSIPVPVESSKEYDDVTVTGIVFDSRKVEEGNIFVALKGDNFNGHNFIPDAIKKGAIAVIGSDEISYDIDIPYFKVTNTRETLAHVSAALFDFPAKKLIVIGVTGTDGKTTTTNLIYHILLSAGIKAGMISTVNAVIGDETLDTGFHVTTPEAPDVQRYLSIMVNEEITHVVLEATSHGLAQDRVTACEFDIGVVTNITHEHLDYHGSYEEYFTAKARLFEFLSTTAMKKIDVNRCAILNKDDISYDCLKDRIGVKKFDYSCDPNTKADIFAEDIKVSKDGINFNVIGKNINQQINCPLTGKYNVQNCLAAIAATVYGLGIDPNIAADGIGSINFIPGRMERIDLGQDFTAIVDFAHTPNALREALKAAREMTDKRVIAIFGSAGLRDRQKRKMMAEISLSIADITILTAEDPRTESLDDILNEMSLAAINAGGIEGKNFLKIYDRGDAIKKGIALAKKDDIVIACGKGHEQSMCFGNVEYNWDDRTAMRSALAEYLNVAGPKMPFLPTQEQ